MRTNRHSSIVALAIVVAMASTAAAQRNDFIGRSEIQLSGGGMFYIGDLNNQSMLSLPRWAASAALHTRIDNRWSARVEAAYGNIGCDNDYIERRNLNFESTIMEGTALVEFDFKPYGPGATESQWTPYIFGGIGVFHYNPMAIYQDSEGRLQRTALQPLHTEGQGTSAYPERRVYRLTQACLPFGVGMRWRLGKTVTLNVEYGFRKTWTDYIDDVSTTYVGSDLLRAEVPDGELAAQLADRSSEVVAGYVNAAGIKRGDDSLDDWYTYLHVSIGFSLETLLGWTRSKRCRP